MGFDPKWLVHADTDSPIAATEQAINDLRADGFAPANIAVLCLRGQAASVIAGAVGWLVKRGSVTCPP